ALWDTRILNKNRAPFSECFDMNDIWGPYYLRGALILFQSFILTPLSLCKRLLENFIYLGPLREIPSRGPREDNKITSAAWSSGIAAWEVLGSVSEDKLDSVNKVLGDEELLNTGYEIRRKRIIELDTEAESFLYEKLKALLDGDFDKNLVAPLKNFLDQPPRVKISLINKKEEIEVQPRDMGTGISQMVPCVVAAAIAEGKDIIAIEQPELHIHPAWQTALADVFIKAIADRPDPPLFILETHSEHFMLRLLRRIRQTTEGDLPDGFPEVAPNMVSVYYIYPGKEGDAEIVGLPIDEEGNFTERWPHGFFEERIKEFM
ncbi:MAG: DUF3696 domain-containing protein, partial [Desulfovibrio sp.]|nr:DUF3696 domain-containing protein [Desulfovibrio sp.]